MCFLRRKRKKVFGFCIIFESEIIKSKYFFYLIWIVKNIKYRHYIFLIQKEEEEEILKQERERERYRA